MNASLLRLAAGAWLLARALAAAAPVNPATDWFQSAKYGAFMHFLPSSPAGLAQVRQFDVQALAAQLEEMGVGYFVLTLGQNSGYFNAPNAAYDRRTGYAPGERCSARDLPLDLHRELHARGIRLFLYLPCQAPNQDPKAQQAFGLPQGAQDQPVDTVFAAKWAEVIQEWADRYGDKVAGWWFDGGYQHIHFTEDVAAVYAAAVKHCNPAAIVTFNPGVQVIRWTRSEDYTAGELNEPLGVVPAGRWLDGSQWHALTYLGSAWGQRDTRYTAAQWVGWAEKVAAHQGVFTLDMGPNYDPSAGPIGALAPAQVDQVKAIRAALRPASGASGPRRLKRAESFFGLHFDFHAARTNVEIGRHTTPAMVDGILDAARPDYLQIDCKGHPGISSYPTRAGNPAPSFAGDPLRVWREATARRGVALYMHYSGVWDYEAIRRHPDWAVINADGSTNGSATSFFGPYADRLMIPQLRELASQYGVDGAWVDGDCWGAAPDYGPAALRAFTAATGWSAAPRGPADPHWFEFLQFNREAYRRYLRHYLAEVRRDSPEMQLCSNWAFSDHMPEAVSAPVDWISGDFSPEDAVNSARFSGRYLSHQGKPWDLMAWGFTIHGEARNGSHMKSAVQLEREAAVVLAQGGGFQCYFNQRPDGSFPEDNLPVIAELAKFCRARQPFCQGAVAVPQVALLYSTASHYREIHGLFNRDLSRLAGTLQALVESGLAVDVLSEHNLTGRMADYPCIVVGECDYLDPAFRRELTAYAEAGGRLLLLGPQCAALFGAAAGVAMEAARPDRAYLSYGGALAPTRDLTATLRPGPGAQVLGSLHAVNDAVSPGQPAAVIAPLGRGVVAATAFSFSRAYLDQRSPVLRGLLRDLMHELFPAPLVEVEGASGVEVTVNRLHGRLAVNLVNTSGPHWDAAKPLIDALPPLGPLAVTLRLPSKPAALTLQPENQPLVFTYANGVARTTVPKLEIHSILLAE